MKPAFLLFFVFLILVVPGIGFCAAASPEGTTNTSQNLNYWIKLDPVSDKHVNDTFVVTGTTNIPAGEPLRMGIYSTLMHSGRYPSPRWYREDVVTILKGTGENNTFTTPLITPVVDIKDPKFYATYPDGTKMTVWVEGEYYVQGEYSGNVSVERATALFNIIPDTVQTPAVTDVYENPHPPAEAPVTTLTPKASSPVLIVLLALGIAGIMCGCFRKIR